MNLLPQTCDRSDSQPSSSERSGKRPALFVFLAACVGSLLWPMVAGNAEDDSWSMDRIVTKAPESAGADQALGSQQGMGTKAAETPAAQPVGGADFSAQRGPLPGMSASLPARNTAASGPGIRSNRHVDLPYDAAREPGLVNGLGKDPGQPPHQDFQVIMPVAQRAQPRFGQNFPAAATAPGRRGMPGAQGAPAVSGSTAIPSTAMPSTAVPGSAMVPNSAMGANSAMPAGSTVSQAGFFTQPQQPSEQAPDAQNAAFLGQTPPNPPQSTEELTPHVGSAGDLIVFSGVGSSGSQTITVIHTRKMQIAVYHIDGLGKIQLKSSRPIDADFALTFNATAPLPQEIRQMATEVK